MVLCLFFKVLKGWEFSHLSFMNEENKGALAFVNLGCVHPHGGKRTDMKLTNDVFALVESTVDGLGYELVEVQYKKEQGHMVLTLFIDSPNGIKMEDCERVSRAVDPILDEADPISEQYYLSVSSLGLDRPIKSDRDFERNLGKKVAVKLYAPKDGKKEFTGLLEGFDQLSFVITDLKSGEQLNFLKKEASSVKPVIEFE